MSNVVEKLFGGLFAHIVALLQVAPVDSVETLKPASAGEDYAVEMRAFLIMVILVSVLSLFAMLTFVAIGKALQAVCRLLLWVAEKIGDAWSYHTYRPRLVDTTTTDEMARAAPVEYDVTHANGDIVVRNGKRVLKLNGPGCIVYAPVIQDFIVHAASDKKEQVTSSLSYVLSEAQVKKMAPCLATLYHTVDGKAQLTGQTAYVKLPVRGDPKVLMMTAHQWHSLEALLALGSQITLRGSSGTVAITNKQVKLYSLSAEAEHGADIACAIIDSRIPAAIGLRATTIDVAARGTHPILCWRTLSGSVEAATTTLWKRHRVYQRIHTASTVPGASGAPLLSNKGRLVGMHTERREVAGENLATDLSVVFPIVGPRKESWENVTADYLQTDPDADPTDIVEDYSDPRSGVAYFKDSDDRLGITTRELMVDQRGHTWADMDDDDDDEPLVYKTKEQWERERSEWQEELDQAMGDQQDVILGKRAARARAATQNAFKESTRSDDASQSAPTDAPASLGPAVPTAVATAPAPSRALASAAITLSEPKSPSARESAMAEAPWAAEAHSLPGSIDYAVSETEDSDGGSKLVLRRNKVVMKTVAKHAVSKQFHDMVDAAVKQQMETFYQEQEAKQRAAAAKQLAATSTPSAQKPASTSKNQRRKAARTLKNKESAVSVEAPKAKILEDPRLDRSKAQSVALNKERTLNAINQLLAEAKTANNAQLAAHLGRASKLVESAPNAAAHTSTIPLTKPDFRKGTSQ